MGGAPVGPSADDWPVYGHDTSSSRYSPLTDITRENVGQLRVAWTYHTGDISDGKGQRRRSGFETTPIVVDGTLYLTTGFNRVIALDPASGAERWSYDPRTVLNAAYGDGLINRGVATWLDSTRASSPSMPPPASRAPTSAAAGKSLSTAASRATPAAPIT